ncbi:lipase family protein [Sutcliffiella sp. NPDC057660]|uniref:lipase family protein n=1 Tax=Sutcliffiella sp. NPDC057660 TaxID=3346199 RepID=UPI0036CB05D4
MKNDFIFRRATLLAGFSYQAYPLFIEGRLVLPKGFVLRYIVRALANVEDPTEEVFGFIAESKSHIVLAFRGYVSYPADLIAAYDILQIPYPFVRNAGKTSRGFTCIYQSTRDDILAELNKLSPDKTLYITGHNYGGAIATLAALDIACNSPFTAPVLYTYGSPRVGDPQFAYSFHTLVKNSMRIVNIHDSFTTFPAKKYPPPFTAEGIYYQHVHARFPISFQLNNTPRNDSIGCYFHCLRTGDPQFATALCSDNPGFCPPTDMCFPFTKGCKCQGERCEGQNE